MSGFIKRATAAASAAVITLTATGCSNGIFKEYQSREEISVPTEISFAWWGGDMTSVIVAALTGAIGVITALGKGD